MDHSIVARTTLAKMRRVDQHQRRASKGRSTSLALSTALASCADQVAGHLSTNELAMLVSHRMAVQEAIASVDAHTLFTLFVSIDTELQRRKDESDPTLVPLIEDAPARTPFASVADENDGDYDMEAEAYAVRHIHAECLDTEDYYN